MIHKLTIRGKVDGSCSPNDLEFQLDGRPLEGLTKLDFRLRPDELIEVDLSMMAQLEADLWFIERLRTRRPFPDWRDRWIGRVRGRMRRLVSSLLLEAWLRRRLFKKRASI